MSSNQAGGSGADSSSSTNGNGNSNGGSDTIIAIVALVVSVIALIGTGLQVVQQYMASAAGYSNCDAAVIGPWHTTKKRRFRLSEMRFQVLFETPVFFVCPADNKRGPINGAPVWFVKGDPESIVVTRSLPLDGPGTNNSADKPLQQADGKQNETTDHASQATSSMPKIAHVLQDKRGVHTADNEMSTWVRLLQELHRMERDSQHWQKTQVELNPPHSACSFEEHKLCVALQSKKRSWDTMPSSISRPYAASTICHLIEMAAMLGIYWKEFDRSAGRYRAEGNGYVLTGNHMADLGIVFTFQICGKSRFKENRIIPADEAKELAFGLVPTIFRRKEDLRRLAFTSDDTRSLETLLLGNRNELAETLASIGCNTNTSNSLRDETKKHGHLFPLAFEITGMLGRTLHIKKSLFRFLPNPTFYHWDRKYFSMQKLLQEYRSEIGRLGANELQIKELQTLANLTADLLLRKPERDKAGRVKRALEDTIDRPLMTVLHENLDRCDLYLKRKGRKAVEIVLREHVQELLHMVNNEGDYGPGREELAETAWLQQDDVHSDDNNPNIVHADKFGAENIDADVAGDDVDGNGNVFRRLEAASVWCTLVFRMLCWLLLHDFIGIFKEARSAYKEKKETLRQERHSGIRRARTFDLSRSGGYHGPPCEVEEYDDAHHYDQREGYYHNHRSLGQAASPLYLEDGGHSRRLSLDGGDRRSHYSLNNRQPRRSQRSSTGSGTSVNGTRSSFRPHQPPLNAHNLRDLSEACDGHSQAPDSRRNSYGLNAKTSGHNLVPLRSALNDIPPRSVTHTAALPQGSSNSPAVALSSPRASILVHRPRSFSALSRQLKDSGNVPPPKLIDTNLAYGNIPPDLESRIDLDPEAFVVDAADEFKESYATTLVDRIETLLNEAQCIHHTAASIIRHLQDRPEAAAAVAVTLAELSALLTKLSPAYLGVVKGGSPAVFALLASPQFLIGTSIVVGATVILFGGWKIVKRISEVRAAPEEGKQAFATGDQSGGFSQQHAAGIDSEIQLDTAEEPLSALRSSSRGYEEALVLEEELCTIETWRRGIEPVLDGGPGIKPWEAKRSNRQISRTHVDTKYTLLPPPPPITSPEQYSKQRTGDKN
ncbi:hypothetical protein HMPREF1624_06720 [Sporothrix schenckii ATCC 58251]|uniref:Modin n=1 Tax=Sporothrix schenckii (strain ATCC 58251 / de Perez 2211183) TaxID=1391915 RepID=U7PNM0_SPOS1|nr:hypothetical protein HMPREF1624_06720 [Sporothrix schenckii ATCC 58251]